MSECIPFASVAYFRGVGGCGDAFDATSMTDDFVREIEILREEVRMAEGGGGMCHVLSEIMQQRFGWPMLSVAYLSTDGEVICASHIVSILPDGSVLDTTRDQFGEGHSVSFVAASSEEIGRYRPEFYEDFFPGHPDDKHGDLASWLANYDGQLDGEAQDSIELEKGERWWLSDFSLIDAWEARQAEFAKPRPTMASHR